MEKSILNCKDKAKSDFVFGDEHKVSICIKENNAIAIDSAGTEKFNMYIAYPSPCAAACLSAQIYSPALDQACLSIVKHLAIRFKRPILLTASSWLEDDIYRTAFEKYVLSKILELSS